MLDKHTDEFVFLTHQKIGNKELMQWMIKIFELEQTQVWMANVVAPSLNNQYIVTLN